VTAPRRPSTANRSFLDRKSKVPLYLQIKDHVRRTLPDAALRNGRLFTEHDLCQRFGVSRMTVRQAIKELADEGLLSRVRGMGTFLSSQKVTEPLESLRDHFEVWGTGGRSVTLKLLDFRKVEAGSEIARRLRIPERTEVLHLLRLWVVDGAPVGLVYFYIHPSAARGLSPPALENTHVRVAISRRMRIPMLGEDVEIEAGVASRVTADRLKIRAGDPVLIRRMTQHYGNHQPLVAANGFYRGDLYRYAVYVPAHPNGERDAWTNLQSRSVTVRAIAAKTTLPLREGPRGRRGPTGAPNAAEPLRRPAAKGAQPSAGRVVLLDVGLPGRKR
jgi:GntR family transcriptional regulator